MLYKNPKCKDCGYVFKPIIGVTNLEMAAPSFDYRHNCKTELLHKLKTKNGVPRMKNPPPPPPAPKGRMLGDKPQYLSKKENKSISPVKSFIQASPLKAWNSLALTICSAILIYITYSNKEMTVEELVLAFWPFYLLYVLLCIVMAKVSE